MPARRWLLIGLVALLLTAAWSGLGGVLSLESLIARREALAGLVERHFIMALAVYGLVYIVAVVLALPVATLLTLIGGWLFGALWGTAVTVLAATTGAIVLFMLARGLLHDYFLARTGGLMARLRQEFHAEAASYLLLLRLAPVFPFFIVNLAAALLGARLSTYSWTTLAGILPGTMAYTLAGAGLGGVLESEAARLAACAAAGGGGCRAALDVSALVSRDVVLALAALAGVTLVSLVARRWLARGAATGRTD